MSAYLVSKEHIDALVTAAVVDKPYGFSYYFRSGRKRVTAETATATGRLLWLENLESIKYRYPTDGDGDRPGPTGLTDAEIAGYRHSQKPVLDTVALLKLIDGYEYQSCEHPEWEASEAFAFCQALRKALIHRLPGYDDAPWGL